MHDGVDAGDEDTEAGPNDVERSTGVWRRHIVGSGHWEGTVRADRGVALHGNAEGQADQQEGEQG